MTTENIHPEAVAAGEWSGEYKEIEPMTTPRNPMQPFVRDKHGTVRFKRNAIVEHLLDHGGIGLNELADGDFSQDDWEQFSQLIGYSLCGFHELSHVSDATAAEASRAAKEQGFEAGGCRDDGCEIHCGVERGVNENAACRPEPGTPRK